MVQSQKVNENEIVISASPSEKLFLLTERQTIYGKQKQIIPFEQIPIEERILKTVKVLGEDVNEIAKSIIEVKKKKLSDINE